MTQIAVDTDALDRLADQIRQAATAASTASAGSSPLHTTVAALGTSGLVEAVVVFLASWQHALAEVVDESLRLADAITLVSQSYQDAEAVIGRGLW